MSKNAAKIKDYVINTVADDYENFSLISKEVRDGLSTKKLHSREKFSLSLFASW